MDAFNQYLANSLQYPAAALDSLVEGNVRLIVEVDKDGTLTDVKVYEGLGAGCDEEAMRLIWDAPFQWRPAREHGQETFKGEVLFDVPFSLNDAF